MDDERLPLAVRAQMVLDLIEDRRLFASTLERDGQQAGRLVQNNQVLVFIEDAQWPGLEWRWPPPGAPGSILPEADFITGFQSKANISRSCFASIYEDFAALARRGSLRARAKPLRCCKKF